MSDNHGMKAKHGNWQCCINCHANDIWIDTYYDDLGFKVHMWCSDTCYMQWCQIQEYSPSPKVEVLAALEEIVAGNIEKAKGWLRLALPLGYLRTSGKAHLLEKPGEL